MPGRMSPSKLSSQPLPPTPSQSLPPANGMCLIITKSGMTRTSCGIITVASMTKKMHVASGEAIPGEDERRHARQEELQEGAHRRVDQRVPEQEAHLHARIGPDPHEIVPLQPLGNEVRRIGIDVRLRPQRDRQHPEEREQHDESDDRGRKVETEPVAQKPADRAAGMPHRNAPPLAKADRLTNVEFALMRAHP